LRFGPAATVARACAPLLIAALLSGCADSYLGARTVVVPGKFNHYSCEQLAASHKTFSAKVQDLERLQRKAEGDTAGFIVSGMTYGPTLAQARADRRIVEETQAEKSCEENPKP
jgi:hypothetical protein